MMFSHETLQRQPARLVLLEALVLVGLIGWVDHVTHREWSCFATYCVADWQSNPYQTHWGFALAVAGWWFYFSAFVVAVTALKARRKLDRERIETLERTQALERQILRTSEREQQRIGRDLHDSPGPQLAAIRYAATFLANELRRLGQPEVAKAVCRNTSR
jgi:signal transduction histidine kinase